MTTGPAVPHPRPAEPGPGVYVVIRGHLAGRGPDGRAVLSYGGGELVVDDRVPGVLVIPLAAVALAACLPPA